MIGRPHRNYGTILLIVGGALLSAGALVCCAMGDVAWIIEESGPVEHATWIAYVAAAVLVLVVGAFRHPGTALASSIVLLALAARELDFHARFTTRGVLSMRFWTTGDHALATKAMTFVVLAGIIATAIILFRLHFDTFRRAVADRKIWALTTAAAIVLLPLVKIVDRGFSFVREHTGAQASEHLAFAARAVEESLELAIPALVIAALVHFWLAPRPEPIREAMVTNATI